MRGKVSKARMQLVRSRCQQIRTPKLEHTAWQDGARTPFPGTACARSLGNFSPRKVDGTRAKDPRCASAGFSQGPAYKSRPGLLTRLGQIGVLGSAGGSTGWKNVSSRAGSKDSQRLRGWIQDEPGDDLHAGSIAEEEQPVKPLFTKQIADRHCSSSRSRSQTRH